MSAHEPFDESYAIADSWGESVTDAIRLDLEDIHFP